MKRQIDPTREILPDRPLERYLQSEACAGWNDDTRATYRRALYELQDYLADHGPPTPQALEGWRRHLEEKGYRQRSVNIRIAAANNYFRWCGRPDLLMHHVHTQQAALPELTRAEYLQLLTTARSQGQQQLYLVVKLFAVTGLPQQCLRQITPALVRAGGGAVHCRGQAFPLRLPAALQKELLAYIDSQGITEGPVFLGRSGRPLERSNLCRRLQRLCRLAGVPAEKASPRCLRALWRATQDQLYGDLDRMLQQTYDRLLQAEQETAGWQTGA